MDIKQSLSYRTETYERIDQFNVIGWLNYKWKSEGILRVCLPKILFKGNTLLVTFLQFIDLKLIMLFKYIERLKRFKYISWY